MCKGVAKPFLKWAGGKGQLLNKFKEMYPQELINGEINTYIEPFVGGGTTFVECKLNNRNAIGIDINPKAVELTKEKLYFDCDFENNIEVQLGDACNLKNIDDNSIDLICTHPPYADIIKYSDYIDGDLSHLKYKEFLVAIEKVASECYRFLKKDKFCAIAMGDTRKNGMVQPLGFEVMQRFINAGFKQKEIIIKEQHNCKATGFWKTNSKK